VFSRLGFVCFGFVRACVPVIGFAFPLALRLCLCSCACSFVCLCLLVFLCLFCFVCECMFDRLSIGCVFVRLFDVEYSHVSFFFLRE